MISTTVVELGLHKITCRNQTRRWTFHTLAPFNIVMTCGLGVIITGSHMFSLWSCQLKNKTKTKAKNKTKNTCNNLKSLYCKVGYTGTVEL